MITDQYNRCNSEKVWNETMKTECRGKMYVILLEKEDNTLCRLAINPQDWTEKCSHVRYNKNELLPD